MLRQYRSQAGYSQSYLAERSGLSPETIGALERGVRQAPYADTLKFLIDALQLSEDERLAIEKAAAAARCELVAQKRMNLSLSRDIPLQLTPLVGRESDIGRLRALVATNRLVTVTGPSGVGKTRVAIDVAARHSRDGHGEARLVDLAAEENTSVGSKMASALGAPSRGQEPLRRLEAFLRARKVLVIIDSCEHVISEVATIGLSLLRKCPDVRLLVASGIRVGAVGEALFRLPALSFPDNVPLSVDEARTYSAVELFIQRAEFEANFAVGAGNLAKVVDICRRLGGIPRSIELAAARLAALGLHDLHARLNEHSVLTGGGRDLPARTQTPLEGVAWSFTALTSSEQLLLRRLSMLSGSPTLEDAEAMCATEGLEQKHVAEVLESLVQKSLVAAVTRSNIVRYRVLDVVRWYCLEKLAESGELDRSSETYTRWHGSYRSDFETD